MLFSVERGTSSTVVVIPALGIALKFARIRPWSALRFTIKYVRAGEWRFARRFWGYSIQSSHGARRLLFRGLVDNWREARYSRRVSHPVLARTYASFGIVNVQEAVGPCLLDTRLLEWRLIGKNRDVYRAVCRTNDLHAFESKNFGVRDGRMVVVDYASLGMQQFLDEYADRVHGLDLLTPPL